MLFKTVILIGFYLTSSFVHAENEKQDMSDPMSVYSGGEIAAGSKGMGGAFQFGLQSGDWGVLGKIEASDNFENYRARLFAPNKKIGTGLFIDAGHDFSNTGFTSNYATVGAMQVVPINDKVKAYVGLTYGQMWEANNLFEDTDILITSVILKYDFTEKFFLTLMPKYTYGLNGEEVRDFSAEMVLGYKVDSDNVVIVSGDSDNNAWLTYRTRF